MQLARSVHWRRPVHQSPSSDLDSQEELPPNPRLAFADQKAAEAHTNPSPTPLQNTAGHTETHATMVQTAHGARPPLTRSRRKLLSQQPQQNSANLPSQLPLGLLNAAQGHPMLVELKNGETLNGHLVNCDTWMNLTLKEVVQTSPVRDLPRTRQQRPGSVIFERRIEREQKANSS